MRISVAVPHTGTLKAETAQALGTLLLATATANIRYNGKPVQPVIELMFAGAGALEWKRTNLARRALEGGSDYILWVDSDQVFPPDALVRLMAHDKAIVAGNYPSRHEAGGTAIGFGGEHIQRRLGLESVAAVGLGFCLMKAPIFASVPHPWFVTEIRADGQLVCGEDVHFCNQARSAGIPVFVDHDLVIGHLAERVLTLEREDINVDTVLPSTGAQ